MPFSFSVHFFVFLWCLWLLLLVLFLVWLFQGRGWRVLPLWLPAVRFCLFWVVLPVLWVLAVLVVLTLPFARLFRLLRCSALLRLFPALPLLPVLPVWCSGAFLRAVCSWRFRSVLVLLALLRLLRFAAVALARGVLWLWRLVWVVRFWLLFLRVRFLLRLR
jgi:hypothetical protein